MYYSERIIGIDPGDKICGLTVLENGVITRACNVTHAQLWTNITELLIGSDVKVALESIKPYSVALSPQTIETCVFIGTVCNSLKSLLKAGCFHLVARNEVKLWAFDGYKEICAPLIVEKIKKGAKRGKYITKNGALRQPSFHFVDDAIVKNVMKSRFSIPDPRPGYPYLHGLKDHSWQSLALCAFLQDRLGNFGKTEHVVVSNQ